MRRRNAAARSSPAALNPIRKKAPAIADAALRVDVDRADWTPHDCPRCGKTLRRRARKIDGRPFLACPDRLRCGFTMDDPTRTSTRPIKKGPRP